VHRWHHSKHTLKSLMKEVGAVRRFASTRPRCRAAEHAQSGSASITIAVILLFVLTRSIATAM
jgi:hypothetical protein